MSFRRVHWLLASLLAVGMIGCGGGGGADGSSGGGGASISLASSSAEITYGEPVTITWQSSGIGRIVESNFGAKGEPVNGSIVDRPATDVTYTIDAEESAFPNRRQVKSVTVRVKKSPKSFQVIGDPAIAGVSQVAQYLEAITTAPVATSITIPAAPTADALVVLESANAGPADHDAIESFLAAGKSVVIVGFGARKLATGSTASDDVSAIGSWLAAATRQHTGGLGSRLTTTALPDFPLSVIYRNAYTHEWVYLRPVSSSAIIVSQRDDGANCFAYEPPIGGKVFYIANYGPGTGEADLNKKAAFLAGCRWATEGP